MERQQVTKTNQPNNKMEIHPATKPVLPTSTLIHPILHLQRALGNQATGRFIQAKLKINQPNDIYEQEADRVAEQVMRMPEPSMTKKTSASTQTQFPHIQRICTECEEELHRQPMEEEEEEILQTKEEGGETTQISPAVEFQINSVRGGGQPLPESVSSFFEPRFGHDFSRVRVHSDAAAEQSARDVSANAYTVGHNIVFGEGRFAPGTHEGRRLFAHELTHVVQQARSGTKIQRAETDDNPNLCFPPGGTPLQDSASRINGWVRGAHARSTRDAIHMVTAVYQELASGGSVSVVESRLGALPATHVRHVNYGSSRYAGTLMWPADPVTRAGLWAAGKIFVAPLINLCGTCVGTDKVGHFFQQGYEYYRLYRQVEARLHAMPEDEQRAFYRRIAGPPIRLDLPLDIETDDEPFGLGRFEVTPAAIVEFAASAFVGQFGRWLEGFNHTLNADDIRWIRSQSFIPFYYSEGVYGAATTGVLSRADLQANRMGFQFYQDLWQNPGSPPDICNYVGGLWNEYAEINTVVPGLGTPRGPVSSSRDVETP